MISKEEIEKLADLSRIKLSAAEKNVLQKDLEAILNYFNKLKSLKIADVNGESNDFYPHTQNAKNVSPKIFDAELNGILGVGVYDKTANEFRENKIKNESTISGEDLLAQAPRKEYGYLKVKKII